MKKGCKILIKLEIHALKNITLNTCFMFIGIHPLRAQNEVESFYGKYLCNQMFFSQSFWTILSSIKLKTASILLFWYASFVGTPHNKVFLEFFIDKIHTLPLAFINLPIPIKTPSKHSRLIDVVSMYLNFKVQAELSFYASL